MKGMSRISPKKCFQTIACGFHRGDSEGRKYTVWYEGELGWYHQRDLYWPLKRRKNDKRHIFIEI